MHLFKKADHRIQCVSQFLVGDPGVLNRVGRVCVAGLSLKRRDISAFIYMVSAHGIPGVMGRVPPSNSSFK